MRFLTCFCMMTSFLLITASNSYADTLYHHIPFDLTLTPADSIVVNYDFSAMKGVHCTANVPHKIQITFAYKGRQKTADLPVILLSDHIPDAKNEQLADLSGQFSLTIKTPQPTKNPSYNITCDYLENR